LKAPCSSGSAAIQHHRQPLPPTFSSTDSMFAAAANTHETSQPTVPVDEKTRREMESFTAVMRESGIREGVIQVLSEQVLLDPNELLNITDSDWQRLYSLGVPVGQRSVISASAVKGRADKMLSVQPASAKFNIIAYTSGLLFALPPLIIGLVNEYGPYDRERALSDVEGALLVILPGILWNLVLLATVEGGRTSFSVDIMEQRSDGTSLREANRTNLTNVGVVGALLLTVVVAMVQVDTPLDETDRLLAQWYMIFLVSSMVPLFASVIMSSMLLLYVEPLDEDAALSYIGAFLDYFGEPTLATIVGIFNFVPALALWIWGVYGLPAGVVMTFCSSLLLRKVVLTQAYLSTWENPNIDEATKQKRKRETRLLVADALTGCCTKPQADGGK